MIAAEAPETAATVAVGKSVGGCFNEDEEEDGVLNTIEIWCVLNWVVYQT